MSSFRRGGYSSSSSSSGSGSGNNYGSNRSSSSSGRHSRSQSSSSHGNASLSARFSSLGISDIPRNPTPSFQSGSDFFERSSGYLPESRSSRQSRESISPGRRTSPARIPTASTSRFAVDSTRLRPGGGTHDPRMARERVALGDGHPSYSSYPPRSPLSQETMNSRSGYEWRRHGEKSAYRGSVPRANDEGYDRESEYPPGSRIRRQYDKYKSADIAAGEASKLYGGTKTAFTNENRRQGLGLQSNHFTGSQHAQLLPLASKTAELQQIHSDKRAKFNEKHIGRMTRESRVGHVRAQRNAYRAADNTDFAAEEHHSGSSTGYW